MTNPPGMTVLFDQKAIAARVHELGQQISKDYQGQRLTLIGVLKGSFIFLADLVRSISLPVEVEFIGVSSYEGTVSSGEVRITNDLTVELKDRHVLLVEDIVDTGTTIDFLINTLQVRKPSSVKIACLLSKPETQIMSHRLDYVGFEISKEFVVGYGLDLDGQFRGLPEIMQMKP